jgi:rhodanese-related sulfurtransferase
MTASLVASEIATITPAGLASLRAEGKAQNLIDVRTPSEYAAVHAQGARLVPLDRLDCAALIQSRQRDGEPIYVLCKSGGRASKACAQFLAAGFADAVCVEGGTEAWERAGLPVVRGRPVMSLERQVRIAAGSLVLSGVVLGALVHWVFFGLSGFVGAGLVFAGITDSCAMGMLLAKMPWNQRVQCDAR